jgi:hypothetical protein
LKREAMQVQLFVDLERKMPKKWLKRVSENDHISRVGFENKKVKDKLKHVSENLDDHHYLLKELTRQKNKQEIILLLIYIVEPFF